jgi:nucleoside-diphosphate-sugar epimerase
MDVIIDRTDRIFNIGSSRPASTKELADLIATKTGRPDRGKSNGV